MDFVHADPATLTIYQLKKGITLMGGYLPSYTVLKSQLIKIYAERYSMALYSDKYRYPFYQKPKQHSSNKYSAKKYHIKSAPVQEVHFASYHNSVDFRKLKGEDYPSKIENAHLVGKKYGKFVWLGIVTLAVFVVASIFVNCINNRMAVNVGFLAFPFVHFINALLPSGPIRASKSLTTMAPHSCPYFALCDELGQVLECDEGYIMVPAELSRVPDMLLYVNNLFYSFRARLNKIYRGGDDYDLRIRKSYKCILNYTYAIQAEKQASKLLSDAQRILSLKIFDNPHDYQHELACLLNKGDCSLFALSLPLTEVTDCSDTLVCKLLAKYGDASNVTNLVLNAGAYVPKFTFRYRIILRYKLYRARFVISAILNCLAIISCITVGIRVSFLMMSRRAFLYAKKVLRKARKFASITNDAFELTISQLQDTVFESSIVPGFVARLIMRRVQTALEQAPDVCCGSIRTSFGDNVVTFWSGDFELDERDFSKGALEEESTHEIAY